LEGDESGGVIGDVKTVPFHPGVNKMITLYRIQGLHSGLLFWGYAVQNRERGSREMPSLLSPCRPRGEADCVDKRIGRCMYFGKLEDLLASLGEKQFMAIHSWNSDTQLLFELRSSIGKNHCL
jgi:hypothetical protein